MAELRDLTVGQVSGMIAAAVFLVQLLFPIVLPVLLLGLLRLQSSAVTETAVSWSVIGRFFHSSLWPVILGTDSAATFSANKSTLFMSAFRIIMLALVAVAAIVTPLGLYEGIVGQAESTSQRFHYIEDPSTFGFGTPPRTRASGSWSRICGYASPYVCPNSPNKLSEFENATGTFVETEWYSSKIPQNVIDALESGLAQLEPSVSSAFDIQYRSYVLSELDTDGRGIPIDNGTTPYTKGSYQPLSTQVLSDSYLAVEGLIVDMKNGGIGFRKHSAPSPRMYGSSWSEDLLFTSPETVCVDTNLTLDFQIPETKNDLGAVGFGSQAFRLNLTDRGGFVNLNLTYPRWERGDTQQNPELWLRAYKAAWINNALSMAFMNITNIYNDTTSLRAFSYLNSTMNKTFPLHYPNGKTANSMIIRPSSLQVATSFGGFLANTDAGRPNVSSIGNQTTNYSFPAELPIYVNPFNISISMGINGRFYNNFSVAELVCAGSGGNDLSNMTNMAGSCGLLYGTPRRQDGGASLLFDPGSVWTLPMYSCMSVIKASIKTVSFRFNGTDDLSGLTVLSIEDKRYLNDDSKPLWVVENSDMPLKHGNPLWGISTPEAAKQFNLSTLRKESLYLPGFVGTTTGLLNSHENLPGADFAASALGAAYKTGQSSSLNGPIDYSGQSNLALYRLWQDYARTAPTSAKILNLIWTDLAANLVLGNRGLGTVENHKRDELASSDLKIPQVTSYTRRIKYKYAYGIPAFLALIFTAVSAIATAYFTIFGHAKPSTMRTFLQHTSAGRLLSVQDMYNSPVTNTGHESYAMMEHGSLKCSEQTGSWIKGAGNVEYTLSADGWTKNVQPHGPGYDKAGTTAGYAPVQGVHAY